MTEWNIYDKRRRAKPKVTKKGIVWIPQDGVSPSASERTGLAQSAKEWDVGEVLDTVDAHYRVIEEQLTKIRKLLEVIIHEKRKD